MRDSEKQTKASRTRPEQQAADAGAVPYDEREFFESFYSATVRSTPTDANTIGVITEMEARFHYNVTENSIIKALARLQPPPAGAAVVAWRMLRRRSGLRLLDVGSGTGHWIDFMTDVFDVSHTVAVEITEAMTTHLRQKYAGRNDVEILAMDIADEAFTAERIGGKVDYVTAIGVMFHIVDDAKWQRALGNLAGVLNDEGLLIVGGNFGAETKDVQFHRTDVFKSWREHDSAEVEDGKLRVNKRVRSLSHWQRVATEVGLEFVDLVRSDYDRRLTTPENDVLILRRTR